LVTQIQGLGIDRMVTVAGKLSSRRIASAQREQGELSDSSCAHRGKSWCGDASRRESTGRAAIDRHSTSGLLRALSITFARSRLTCPSECKGWEEPRGFGSPGSVSGLFRDGGIVSLCYHGPRRRSYGRFKAVLTGVVPWGETNG
jgi:hypothetical protein